MAVTLYVHLGAYSGGKVNFFTSASDFYVQSIDRVGIETYTEAQDGDVDLTPPLTFTMELQQKNSSNQWATFDTSTKVLTDADLSDWHTSTAVLYSNIITKTGTINVRVTVKDKNKRSIIWTEQRNVVAYSRPNITRLAAQRCDSSGVVTDKGEYAKVTFSATASSVQNQNKTTYKLRYKKSTDSSYTTYNFSSLANSYSVTNQTYIFAADTGSSYDIELTVDDIYYASTKTTSVSTAFTLLNFGKDGTSVGVGKVAEESNTFDVGITAKFSGNVCGNVLGLGKLTTIPADSDFNDYIKTGSYAVHANADAETISNIPVKIAGRLEVANAVGGGVNTTGWSSLRQKFIPYLVTLPTYERQLVQTSSTDWEYYEWKATTLNGQKLLWGNANNNAGYFMDSSHEIELSEPISKQPNGIVLVFSACETTNNVTTINDYHFQEYFVPKFIVKNKAGLGHNFPLATSNFAYIGSKYLYISDEKITGNADNITSGTRNGITYNNAHWVLRYVISV